MRLLVASLEFKGTLTAMEACAAIRDGLTHTRPDLMIDTLPLADGGPGTVDAVLAAGGGARFTTRVEGPLGAPVDAHWAYFPAERTAVLEMAAASGLSLLPPGRKDAGAASTFGTGQLIRAALDAGAETIVVGLGGSATNDGGAGAASALGVRLGDAEGRPIPRGGLGLQRLATIDLREVDPRLAQVRLLCASDVVNPLLGVRGAAAVYGPQKGASPKLVADLEAALDHYAQRVEAATGRALAHLPGAGAAGGLGFALVAIFGATIEPGFALIAERIGLASHLLEADWVITGEGRIDRQTSFGKGPAALARQAKALGKKTAVFCGSAGKGFVPGDLFDQVIALVPGVSLKEALAAPETALREAAARFAEGLPR